MNSRLNDILPRGLDATEVFDTYWRFAAERQSVYYARLEGAGAPYTMDPIIQDYKFTNVYRAADRVSQYLIRNVIYPPNPQLTPEDLLFRILLFKLFNKISTWEMLEQQLGEVTYRGFCFGHYDDVLTQFRARGYTIYSAAYIMPSATAFGHSSKHTNHLALVQLMMQTLPRIIARAGSMESVYRALLSYPSIGKFLAYQLAIDINYSELTEFDESEFVVAGPGAIDGIRKAISHMPGSTYECVIRAAYEMQSVAFTALDLRFDGLFGRPLQLIDCQNLFCEVDKYARVAHPGYTGVSGRVRIKQKFKESARLPIPWFPPKWGINGRIPLSNPQKVQTWT